ncbi:MAG: ATP-binding protein [Microscillaceae bacterium]|nr:ATP-binding protein [Microscillaceae bacterium]
MIFKFIHSQPISIQLLFMFLAIEFPAEIVLVYVSYYNAENILSKELNDKLQTTYERQSRQITDYFDNQINHINILVQIPDFIRLSRETIQDRTIASDQKPFDPIIKQSFIQYQESFKLANLMIVSSDRRIVFSTDFGMNIDFSQINSENDEIRQLIDRSSIMLQTEFSDFIFIKGRNYPTAFVATPIQEESGRFLGILIAEINNASITSIVNDYTGLGQTGESIILSQIEGKIVSTTSTRFRSLSEDEFSLDASKPLPVDEALQGRFGSGFYTDYRGREVFAYWNYIPALRSALIVKVDKSEAFASIQNLRYILLLIVLATLGIVVLAAFSAANLFSDPIQKLTLAARRLSEGNLDERIILPQRNEIGLLKDTFNQMAENLQKSQKELQNYNIILEQKVKERTHELQKAYNEITLINQEVVLQKNNLESANVQLNNTLEELQSTQSHLVESEKMAMLGQLVAGIAHEINTPMGAIRSSVSNIIINLDSIIHQLPEFFSRLNATEKELFLQLMEIASQKDMSISAREERKYRRELQNQLEETGISNAMDIAEKLVEMGIYENMENYNALYVSSLQKEIFHKAHTLSGIIRSANTINLASDKASKIVFALKNYARKSYSGEMEEHSITQGIDTVLTIYHNMMKHSVEIFKDFEFVEPILCYSDELNQVWTNIIHNALQAMEYKGVIEISVKKVEEKVLISFKDSGKGIPQQIQGEIFKPFFTTKPMGEGSGLGLDIVKKIIDKHQGKIYFKSEVSIGTTFFIELPIVSQMNTTPIMS